MGTSCAVNYAFLYIGLLEMNKLLTDFQLWLPFYARFINNGIGIWLHHVPGSARAWKDFMNCINNWGKLKWTTTGHVQHLNMLDLTIRINPDNKLEFTSYKKEMNLHLYLPPISAHPPDTLQSLIFGLMRSYYIQNSRRADFINTTQLPFTNLLKRG